MGGYGEQPFWREQIKEHDSKLLECDFHVIGVHDPEDWTMWLAQVRAVGDIKVHNVKEFCEIIIGICCENPRSIIKIRRLTIEGHGNDVGFAIGQDKITEETLYKFTSYFLSMMPLFKRNAIIKIDQCETGQAQSLLKKVSTAFGGVAVKAYTRNTRVMRPNQSGGKWVTCYLKNCS